MEIEILDGSFADISRDKSCQKNKSCEPSETKDQTEHINKPLYSLDPPLGFGIHLLTEKFFTHLRKSLPTTGSHQ